MRIAVYPGSFNPFHKGHQNIIKQARELFDKVIIAIGHNPEKDPKDTLKIKIELTKLYEESNDVEIYSMESLLVDFTNKVNASAVIKGLRNSQDFEYEKIQQYWNEDLGIVIPTIYLIADRNLTHVSSSAIKQIEKFK